MGAGQSKSEDTEKVYYNETPIQFSEDVVNQLSDRIASPETTPERQNTLDAHIRQRIQSDMDNLRQNEAAVRQEIEQALEKENLDRETSMAGEASQSEEEGAHGDVKTSAALLGDLEEIRQKVDRYHTRRELTDLPEVQANGNAVVECYKANPQRPLECAPEVRAFKASVADVEQKYFKTL